MTPVLSCGFECGRLATGAHWTTTTSASITTSSPIYGNRSLLCNSAASAKTAQTNNTFGSAGIWVIRIKLRFDTLPSANTGLCIINTINAGAYFKQSDSKIYAGVSTASLGSTGVSVTTGVVYYIDVRVNSTANPWLTDVQVNGMACGQHSNAVAADTTARTVTIGIVATTSGVALVDDAVISLTSADYPIGDGYVDWFVPTADGTHNVAGAADFQRSLTGVDITNSTTDAYTLIDDVPLETGTPTDFINLIAPPNASDYVEVIFGPAPGVSKPLVAPRAVDVIAAYAAFSTTGNNLRLALNDNGTLNDVLNATVGSTTCKYIAKQYATGPAGAWKLENGAGNFNNIRMRCFTSDAAPDPYFVSVMIEAEFAPVLPPGMYGVPDGPWGQSQMSQLIAQ